MYVRACVTIVCMFAHAWEGIYTKEYCENMCMKSHMESMV